MASYFIIKIPPKGFIIEGFQNVVDLILPDTNPDFQIRPCVEEVASDLAVSHTLLYDPSLLLFG